MLTFQAGPKGTKSGGPPGGRDEGRTLRDLQETHRQIATTYQPLENISGSLEIARGKSKSPARRCFRFPARKRGGEDCKGRWQRPQFLPKRPETLRLTPDTS